MTIDVQSEELITSKEACSEFPGSQRISLAKLNRLWFKGIKGITLESIVIAGRRYTSREAILRFIAAQNADETPIPTITSAQRRRQSEAAQAALEEIGV